MRSSTELLDAVAHGRYDGVAAFGDVTQVLTGGREVEPIDTARVPNYARVYPALKRLPQNLEDGRVVGIPHGRGADVLLWRTDLVRRAPAGWDVLFDPRYAGRVGWYDSAETLVRTAIHLRLPSPYELRPAQFRARRPCCRRGLGERRLLLAGPDERACRLHRRERDRRRGVAAARCPAARRPGAGRDLRPRRLDRPLGLVDAARTARSTRSACTAGSTTSSRRRRTPPRRGTCTRRRRRRPPARTWTAAAVHAGRRGLVVAPLVLADAPARLPRRPRRDVRRLVRLVGRLGAHSLRLRPILRSLTAPDVTLTTIRKTYGDVVAVDSIDLEIARGEFFTMLGPSGSGKTTTLRIIAGFERPDAGRVELRGEDVTGRPPYVARRQHGLPGLRALPAHDGAPERRVRAAREGREAAGAAAARRRGARARPARGLRRPQAGAALGRAAPAGRARARDRQPPAGAAARRAARRARPEAPPGDADRAEADPAGGRDHVRLRDPRPGGGADDERPDRRLQPGPDRPDRHPGRGLRAPGERVRRRVRRDLEPARAGRPAVHDPPREDRDRAGQSPATASSAGRSARSLYAGPVTRYGRRARAGRRGRGRQPELGRAAGSRRARPAGHGRVEPGRTPLQSKAGGRRKDEESSSSATSRSRSWRSRLPLPRPARRRPQRTRES